ncbi:MAG: PAS domain S-box protein [Deltaproteobacteria bacterium]|jgi:two-component system sensor histidine kinase AtoS|uniref:ATP-binding protein n=1 Tax=Hydrosulfovibrio ferrireducens TaxID=2934181 RepID=UPI0012251939|nr:MAG: PAS domain S-box protein [Deltaproteobacteria bacterium]
MRIKAILGFILLVFFFGVGGVYIAVTNARVIDNLEKILALHQMEFLRDNLFNKVKIIQSDLYLTTTQHRTNIGDFVEHGEALHLAGESCSECHHAEPTMHRLTHLRQGIGVYLKKASRMYTFSANHARRNREEENASASGARLLEEIDRLVLISADKISPKIANARQEVARMKNILLGLVTVAPLIFLVFTFLFVKRFSTSLSVLIGATEKIKAGELTHTIDAQLPDEFNTLATAFNEMAVSLKKQCEAVIAEQNRYRILFESADDAIFILEGEGEAAGRIIAANQSAATMHGYTVDELCALSMQDIDTLASAAQAPARIRDILAGGRLEGLVEHRKKDGTVFPVEVRAGLLEIEGRKYILAFDRDVTARNQTEAALQRSRQLAMVGQMAAGLAHEIKNPLAGIKVSMEVLLDELPLSPEDKAIFTRTIGEVQRIESLLKNLLNYARAPRPVFSRIDLNQQLENALRNTALLLNSPEYAATSRKGLQLARNLDPGLPMILADPGQMQQVILNLLLNAMEATPAGGTITVSTKPGRGGTVEVVIGDTGKGMSEEACGKVFQPFYTTKPKGSGLGLAITRRLVEQHHGEIEIVSVVGQGTTVTITLPVEQTIEDESP